MAPHADDDETTYPTGADQRDIDAAWRTEIERRLEDIESGRVELLDVAESHAQLRSE